MRSVSSLIAADRASPAKIFGGYRRKRPSFRHLLVPLVGSLLLRGRRTCVIQNVSQARNCGSQHNSMGVSEPHVCADGCHKPVHGVQGAMFPRQLAGFQHFPEVLSTA